MYVCAIFSSSDIIAAVTLVKFEQQPTIFSVVLGEGLFNDAVAIILFQTMQGIKQKENKGLSVDPKSFALYGEVLLSFISLSLLSILIGVVIGFLCAYLTKVWRFYSHSAIAESGFFLTFAMLSYFTSEVSGLSGIVSLLLTALVQSHYAFYNLSPQGKEVTYVTFQTLGYVSEALVFGFVGLASSYYLFIKPICWQFVVAEFFIVIVGRYLAIYISYYIFGFIPGSPMNKLSFRQLTFISWAALIRGAIAFGLILKTGTDFNKGDDTRTRDVLESSTCFLVIFTTLVFGSFTPLVQKCLLPSQDEEEHVHSHQEPKEFKPSIQSHDQIEEVPENDEDNSNGL
jgi:sodium/hydrogen exchanger-like protein 6/7